MMQINTTNSKDDKVKELFDQLMDGVKQVYSSEKWKEFLLFQSRFHSYSFGNTMLIKGQCPHASYIAGFEKWKQMDRYVKKGERAIKILAPIIKKIENEEGQEVSRVCGFKVANVFDLSQTSGKPIPQLTKELQGNEESHKAFYELLLKSIVTIPVKDIELKGGVKGYYDPRSDEIAIKIDASYEQKCKTLIHEVAHSLLHKDGKIDRKSAEVEAEGTAFVVANYYGFDVSEYSFPYVAGWASGKDAFERIQQVGNTIQKTAHQLITKVEEVMQQLDKEKQITGQEKNVAVASRRKSRVLER